MKKIIFIFFLFVLAFYISLPRVIPISIHLGSINIEKEFVRGDLNLTLGKFNFKRDLDLKLGLDLAGGSHLVFEADTSKLTKEQKENALVGLRNIMERRVNLFGVSEPNVQVSSFDGKDRIIIELPGIKNTKDAINLIGKTAQLVFAEIQITESKEKDKAPTTIFLPTDLGGADLKRAQVVFDQNNGKPAISIEFSEEGGKKFENITQKNIGKPLAIIIDSSVISSPMVQEKITGGQAQITGNFTIEEARNLEIELNSGALPIPVKLVEEKTVEATLGSESIKKSVEAGLVGLLMVIIFMFLSYGRLGLIADLALIIFSVLTLAIYKLFPVVLTLPGIAGFLLSVGMAVDSNILIFERFKEEKVKRPLKEALEVSFGRAWDSIRDANIATLVTAFILANPLDWPFLHTSGPVRGFAITLALGIGISLFTGIFVSRNLLRVFIKDVPGLTKK